MDYKDTLNLPRTSFPMKADLVAREPKRLEAWETGRLYQRIQAARAGRPKYVLHDGPPFANGEVHIGTAGNKIRKDFIVKYQTLRDYCAPYVPGWDCHGLPIEFKVSQDMRKKGETQADPVVIRTRCEAYARKYIDIQRAQFKRLGILGDWDRPYLTLDREYEADELRLFADLVERGFIYRGKKPVYWSIPCRTALAEAEVEYKDHVSPSIYVKFPVVGEPNMSILIWTTTPWTLPANLAIAYHSTFSYSLVLVENETFIVSTLLLSALAEKCRWPSYQIIRSLEAGHLARIEYQHPFCARTGRLYAGDAFVESTTGTGFVHIAPGHGLEDYGLGLAHGLPIYSPVDDDGRLAYTDDLPREQQMPAPLVGQPILEHHGKSAANEAVLDLLRSTNRLVHQEDYVHSYPHCWRSKTPVIFRAMNQWFFQIDHPLSSTSTGANAGPATFRESALEAIRRVEWVPDWGKSRIEAAVQSRPDWCISRQRTWGVPIPVFYDAGGAPILDGQIIRRAADLVEQQGSQAWFERSAADLWSTLKPPGWSGPEAAAKGSDTLDVWIDSGSSSRCVLMRRAELKRAAADSFSPEAWQADMYLEGSDQHRGWFQSSLLLSLAANGSAPYRTVLTHGFMVDAEREKISKSKQGQGGYEKPQTADVYVRKYGADVLRLWIASQDFRGDIIVSEERIQKVAEAYRVIRNALRYQLSNLSDYDPGQAAVPLEELTGLDRWILGEFSRLEQEVQAAYDQWQFHVVFQKLSQFAAVQLSAIYHDVVKDRLYTDPAHSPRRRSTQTALHRMITGLCQVLAPILAFTADEAWEFIPGRPAESVHASTWRPVAFSPGTEETALWQSLMTTRDLVLVELENARQAKSIGKALEAKVRLCGFQPGAPELLPRNVEALRELLNVSQLEVAPAADGAAAEKPEITVLKADGTKCERCWHWETDVGADHGHPTLCGRCVAALASVVTPE